MQPVAAARIGLMRHHSATILVVRAARLILAQDSRWSPCLPIELTDSLGPIGRAHWLPCDEPPCTEHVALALLQGCV